MDSLGWVLSAICVLAASGLPGCFFPRSSKSGQRLTTVFMVAGGGIGLAGLVMSLGETSPASLTLPWSLPIGSFSVALDPLSAFFLALVFIVPPLGSIYGLGYWKQDEHAEGGRALGFFYGLLAASMAMLAISRDALLFLIAWETMAISAWFAATSDEANPESRRAGWVYLVATHVGTLCLLAMFTIWSRATGSSELQVAASIPDYLAASIFILALLGFGLKAGLAPLHVWLPGAHANAPSHVSALLSGVMLKMGIYGIVRICSLLPLPPEWWGWTLLVAGTVSGLWGIALGIGQRDVKRFLAYSSIENIGIIAMGIGVALLGRATGRPEQVALGMGAALFHAWNHGLFKPLLFFNAGAVIHASGTRNMDTLGGLAKGMPLSAILFAIAAVAICGLPPLNGFVGEFLLYLGLFGGVLPVSATVGGTSLGGGAVMGYAIAAVSLAAVGSLAIAGFVRSFAAIWLGSPRSEASAKAHDPGWAMTAPSIFLAIGCILIGLCPPLVLPLVQGAVNSWAAGGFGSALVPPIASLAPLGWLTQLGIGLAVTVLFGLVAMALKTRAARKHAPLSAEHSPVLGTWDCGYASPTPRMQYNASSFSGALAGQLSFALRPRRRGFPTRGAFPRDARFKQDVPDPVLERLLRPLARLTRLAVSGIRRLQAGQTQLYILYVLVITAILLVLGVAQP